MFCQIYHKSGFIRKFEGINRLIRQNKRLETAETIKRHSLVVYLNRERKMTKGKLA